MERKEDLRRGNEVLWREIRRVLILYRVNARFFGTTRLLLRMTNPPHNISLSPKVGTAIFRNIGTVILNKRLCEVKNLASMRHSHNTVTRSCGEPRGKRSPTEREYCPIDFSALLKYDFTVMKKETSSKLKQWLTAKIDPKCMRFGIWLAFMIFTAIVLGFVWLTQFFFMDLYYTKQRVKELETGGDYLAANYTPIGYQTLYSEYARQKNLSVMVVEVSSSATVKVNYSSETNKFGLDVSKEQPLTQNAVIADILNRLDDANGNSVTAQTVDNTEVIFAKKINTDGKVYLLVSYNIGQVQSTIDMLEVQLWITTIMVIVLAFIFSILISGIVSKQIRDLSKTAEQLAAGKTDVHFKENGFTETRELASTLNYATTEINKTESLRRELIANVSHDLRTPLTIVKGYAELIRDISGDNPEKREEHLARIIKETDRLTVLVRDMLNLSKMESGAGETHHVVFNLSDAVVKVGESFKVYDELQGYSITSEVEPDITVKGDPTRMELVLYNLVSNAVNYTGEDKKVTITLRKEGERARFGVKDTGPGMDDEQVNMIWQRYYRAKEHKRAVVGSGLGLSIVKAILDAHPNVDYGVDTALGKGSEFYFSLPIETE